MPTHRNAANVSTAKGNGKSKAHSLSAAASSKGQATVTGPSKPTFSLKTKMKSKEKAKPTPITLLPEEPKPSYPPTQHPRQVQRMPDSAEPKVVSFGAKAVSVDFQPVPNTHKLGQEPSTSIQEAPQPPTMSSTSQDISHPSEAMEEAAEADHPLSVDFAAMEVDVPPEEKTVELEPADIPMPLADPSTVPQDPLPRPPFHHFDTGSDLSDLSDDDSPPTGTALKIPAKAESYKPLSRRPAGTDKVSGAMADVRRSTRTVSAKRKAEEQPQGVLVFSFPRCGFV